MDKLGLEILLNNQIYLEFGEILFHMRIEELRQMIMLKFI